MPESKTMSGLPKKRPTQTKWLWEKSFLGTLKSFFRREKSFLRTIKSFSFRGKPFFRNGKSFFSAAKSFFGRGKSFFSTVKPFYRREKSFFSTQKSFLPPHKSFSPLHPPSNLTKKQLNQPKNQIIRLTPASLPRHHAHYYPSHLEIPRHVFNGRWTRRPVERCGKYCCILIFWL